MGAAPSCPGGGRACSLHCGALLSPLPPPQEGATAVVALSWGPAAASAPPPCRCGSGLCPPPFRRSSVHSCHPLPSPPADPPIVVLVEEAKGCTFFLISKNLVKKSSRLLGLSLEKERLVARINLLFEKHIQTHIFNLKSFVSTRSLNPSDIEKMVSVKRMIIRCSFVILDIKEAVFQCLICGHFTDTILVDRVSL